MALKGAQKRKLRALAHALEPVVQVGRAGLTGSVLGEISSALDVHELVKVRFRTESEDRKAQFAEVAAALSAELVGAVGHVAILFRPNPDPEQRKIFVD